MSNAVLPSEQAAAEHPLVAALKRVRPSLKWVLAHFRLSPEDAEDVLQDLCLWAIRKANQIEDLDNWLVGTANKLCLALLSQRRIRAKYQAREVGFMVEGELRVPEALLSVPAMAHLEFRVDLARALPLLPAKPRQAVVLHAMGFGPSEIAFQTGYSPESVRRILGRGLAYLRLRLGGPDRSSPSSDGRPVPQSSMALPPPSPARLLKLAVRSWVNPSTKRTYVRCLRAFARWLGCGDPAAAVAELLSAGPAGAQEIVVRYRTALVARGCASATVKLCLAPLSAVVRLAREHGLIDWRLEVGDAAPASGRAEVEECR
jgi:RNA polymerase sigma factor (sigma-70 family)